MTDPCLLPSACHDGIGTRTTLLSPLNTSPIRPLSTLRVLPHGNDPRITRASVDRYSFTVTDFHHLPPAGLPGAPQLNTWPVVSPVNASRRHSGDAAPHSGLGRLASPFPWGTFTSYSLPLSWRTQRWANSGPLQRSKGVGSSIHCLSCPARQGG
jgi:hypothetical protein